MNNPLTSNHSSALLVPTGPTNRLWNHQLLAALTLGLMLACPGLGLADNLAPLGSGILGFNAAVDSAPGTLLFHVGTAANINDGDPGSRVDNYSDGNDQGQGVSFVGVLWPTLRYEQFNSLTLTLAAFFDGGWFGPNGVGPGAGGALTSAYLVEPTLQVSTNEGVSWTTVNHTSDYLTVLDGATIGGGANPNPMPLTATFTLVPPVTNINGIRIIGSNGGPADGNGFIGVFELEIQASLADSDGDGMADSWEQIHGLVVGFNDAGYDPDFDGLSNGQEFQAGTNPHRSDTDGDSLIDGEEILTTLTNPLKADSDGDGLSDSVELMSYYTNPLVPDSDGDGLSDGVEVHTHHTEPLLPDTDGDGYSDGVEVTLGSDPKNPQSIPGNLGLQGQGIIGTESSEGVQTPWANVGVAGNVNDGNFNTRVDTWNNLGTAPSSYVGILWYELQTNPIVRLELTLATFLDGGWFGPNNKGPGAGGALTAPFLSEPAVQVTTDGGTTWTPIEHSSDYLIALNGHRIGGGTVPNPSSASAVFTLKQPAMDINGIRLVGSEGGTASGGFLGVFELGVYAKTDSDLDGLDDDWEIKHGLVVGLNDADLDPDNDGLSNLGEYQASTDPRNADSDGDGLTDGAEVNTHHTNPGATDTDEDTLTDGDEVLVYHSNPLNQDTDDDGYSDPMEVRWKSDPNLATSTPSNLALRNDATGILGTEDFPGGTDTPVFNAGVAANLNDDNLDTRVDTYNGIIADTLSYVGILWTEPLTNPVARLELNLAIFFDGGWFGVNNSGPGSGGVLSSNQYLIEPTVQVTSDGGLSWSNVVCTSDYLTALEGHPLPDLDFGPPTRATSAFELTPPLTGINGLRIIGSEGGTASGGFLGVFELAVMKPQPQGVKLLQATVTDGFFRFEFDTQVGVNYIVQFKEALSDASWQIHSNLSGDGTRRQITDTLTSSPRFYRVISP